MLYVLVNNDYQLRVLRQHGIKELAGEAGATLIAVPHALSSALNDMGEFQAVHRFDTPLGRRRLPFTLLAYAASARSVASALHPGPQDTLLFFTEMEWLNQIVVQHFRRCGARIVMMEDGGFATYIPMSLAKSEHLTLRERCIEALYRIIPELRQSRLFKVSGVLFPRLPDAAIDVIALYRDVPLRRRVPTCLVRKPDQVPGNVRPSTVIFLNQDMYFDYQSSEAYLAGLRRLLTALKSGFKTVYFKFHPREPEIWKRRISEILAKEFPTIEIILRSGPIEEMVMDYRPEALASYFSAALLNIEYEGVEPLYLYHLLDDLKNQAAFTVVSQILRVWGYRFVSSDEEICSGYRSGIAADSSAAGMDLRQLLSSGACSDAGYCLNK